METLGIVVLLALYAIGLVVSLLLVVVVLGGGVGVPAVIPFLIGVTDRTIPWIARLTLISAPFTFALTIALLVRAFGRTGWRAWVGVPPPMEIKIAFLPALALGVAGAVILAYGTRAKSDPVARAGAWAVAAAVGSAVVAAVMIGINEGP